MRRLIPARAPAAVALALAACALARVARASAEEHPRVALRIDPCVAADPVEVRRIVATELDARLADESEPDTTRVEATCEGALVRLDAVDPITGKSLVRIVHLDSASPSARPRLLSLAIAELVSASWTELAYNPRPAVPPATPPPSAEAKAAALRSLRERTPAIAAPASAAPAPHVTFGPEPSDRTPLILAPAKPPEAPAPPAPTFARAWSVDAFFEARALVAPGVTSVGFGAAVTRRARGPLGVRLDVLADHGQKATSLGTVSIDALSFGPSAFLEAGRGPLSVRAAVGVRIGVASLSGRPADADERGGSFASPWGGPFAGVAGHLEIARGIGLTAGGEIGDAPFPARGEVLAVQASDVSIVGALFGGYAGVRASF